MLQICGASAIQTGSTVTEALIAVGDSPKPSISNVLRLCTDVRERRGENDAHDFRHAVCLSNIFP
jgi:hypothetical protein